MLLTKIVSVFAIVATAVYATPVLEERGGHDGMQKYHDKHGHDVWCKKDCYWDWRCNPCKHNEHVYDHNKCCDSEHWYHNKCNACPWNKRQDKWGHCVSCRDDHWWGNECHDCDHSHWYNNKCNRCEEGSHWDGHKCNKCKSDCWYNSKCNQCPWKMDWHKDKHCCWDSKKHRCHY